MGITIREFQVAMETVGAKRLADREGSRCNVYVPCFYLKGVEFLHSGSCYIVLSGQKVPDDIMNRAMAELGEKHPGEKNFWWGAIHSIKGILTLATMLEGNYSKELLDELINKTYKNLLDCSLIKSNVEFPFTDTHNLPKMQKLRELLKEYSNVVNPFGNCNLKFKDPIEYLDKVRVKLKANEGKDKYHSSLYLMNSFTETNFENDINGWCYDSIIPVQIKRKNGIIHIIHYYYNGNDIYHNIDEVVYLSYASERNKKSFYSIDLRISLKTGLAWNSYKEEAKPVTEEQLDIMIWYLKMTIKKLNKKIIRNIIK